MFLAELQELHGNIVIVANNSGSLAKQHEQIVLARSEYRVFIGGSEPEDVLLSVPESVSYTALGKAAVSLVSLNIIESENTRHSSVTAPERVIRSQSACGFIVDRHTRVT